MSGLMKIIILVVSLNIVIALYVSDAEKPEKLGIVGGVAVPIEEFPFQVSMQHHDRHYCGGSIISDRFVLTAAHCVIGFYPQNFTIVAGSADIKNGGQRINVIKVIKHHKYNQFDGDSDLCLLKLEKPLEFSSKIAIVPLANEETAINRGTVFNVTGWGDDEYLGHNSQLLMRSSVPFVDRNTCIKDYDGINVITKRMLCAGTDGHDACQGDSGGPLTLNGVLVGIVSRGKSCAMARYPTIYTKITRFRKWISKRMERNL